MKKIIPFGIIVLCVLAFTVSFTIAERGVAIVLELPEKELLDFHTGEAIPESKFPASVEIIEDEAFEGTALGNVELPNSAIKIGERAFADISTLRDVRIPFTTQYIASSAFDGSDKTTITAPVNSYARVYARNHGLPFSPVAMFCATTQMLSISSFISDRSKEVIDIDVKPYINPETQWRRIEELNIIRTEKLIANHVQGRAPPMV